MYTKKVTKNEESSDPTTGFGKIGDGFATDVNRSGATSIATAKSKTSVI